MLSFTKNQLFDIITSEPNWFKAHGDRPAYCNATAAGVLKHRHKKGQLSQESYDNLFFHFGYKKELLYTKN